MKLFSAFNNIDSANGAARIVPVQTGFPAELTSSWDTSTGYSWIRLYQLGVAVTDPDNQGAGQYAVTIDGNTTLTAGTRGWMEPDPGAAGWLFLACGVTGSDGAPGGVVVNPGPTDPDTTIVVEQYAVPVDEATTTTPAIQQYVTEDYAGGGTDAIFQAVYPNGTGAAVGATPVTAPTYSALFQPTQTTVTNTISGTSVYEHVTESSNDVLQFHTGDSDSATGFFRQFTIDGQGDVSGLVDQFVIDSGGNVTGSITYSVSGGGIVATGSNITLAGSLSTSGTGTWTKYTKTYSDLSAAAATNDIELFSLAAKTVIHAVVIKSTTQFSGGTISSYGVSVGIAGDLDKYSEVEGGTATHEVGGAVSDTNFGLGSKAGGYFGMENFGSATSIRLRAVSVGGNLDTATQGVVDVYVLTSTLP
jgi:hypothetical protein